MSREGVPWGHRMLAGFYLHCTDRNTECYSNTKVLKQGKARIGTQAQRSQAWVSSRQQVPNDPLRVI